MSYWMKFIGNATNSPTSGSPVTLELKILGVLYSGGNLAEVDVFFGNKKRRGYVEDVKLIVQFEPFSTVSASQQNTGDIILLENIFKQNFKFLSKPTSPRLLPPRWVHGTGFDLLDFFETPYRVELEGSIEPSKNWGSAQETLELTFLKAD